ncbi:MAG: hypothetical protein MUP76_07975 [Acidimicrobiia bacterium]|nr:hypothetical protein [Acidimicrobiia bacterium]
MIRRTLSLAVVLLALGTAGCSNHLGRTEPACDSESLGASFILSAQSIRGAAYVPCINELKPGWKYEDLEAESGRSRFWISSDRVGHRFLEVTLESSCDMTGAVEVDSDEPGIPLFVSETAADFHIAITVVPEGGMEDYRDYAVAVAQEIGATRIGNRRVRAGIDFSDLPTAERIRLALANGHAALVVGAREYEERTVELHTIGPRDAAPTVRHGLQPAEAVEEAGESLGDPVYRAVWYYPFENGCVTYRFDAMGSGVDKLALKVQDALGFTPLAPLRKVGEELGYVIP